MKLEYFWLFRLGREGLRRVCALYMDRSVADRGASGDLPGEVSGSAERIILFSPENAEYTHFNGVMQTTRRGIEASPVGIHENTTATEPLCAQREHVL